MLNAVYRLTAPGRFEIEFNDYNLNSDKVIVRPTNLSICNADQRYYRGMRSEDVMQDKLPMALIHEAIGDVVFDPKGEFEPGLRVVMIPNTPSNDDNDEIIAENYRRTSKFRASGFDGFMQDVVAMDRDRILPVSRDIDTRVAAFTELVSVGVHAISRFDKIAHPRRERIAVFGDGNLGYIVSTFLHALYEDSQIYVFGLNMNKLMDFTFAEETFNVTRIPDDMTFDHAFECVGGEGSQKAINQIIDYIKPEGCISIMGVSENNVAINTRMILEKGLRMFGSSRSGRADFERTLELYKEHPEIVEYLTNIIGNVLDVRNTDDMRSAFEMDWHRTSGKTIMNWMV